MLCIYVVILLWGTLAYCKRNILQKYVYNNGNGTLVHISYGNYGFQVNDGYIIFHKSGFIMDSGCSSSYIVPDTLLHLPNFNVQASICITDVNNEIKEYPLYFVPTIKIDDSLIVRNVVAYPFEWTSNKTSAIGMDIISTANWHFNFNNNTVNITPVSETAIIPQKHITFSYTKTKDPLTNLVIGNNVYDNVLLDMGMVDWDMCLTDSDLSLLFQNYIPIDSSETTSYGHNSSYTTTKYYFDSVSIDAEIYRDICIRKGSKNIIGMDFFRRFDHLFWDSKNKKVYLWNDEK